jgi:hypothetical protein
MSYRTNAAVPTERRGPPRLSDYDIDTAINEVKLAYVRGGKAWFTVVGRGEFVWTGPELEQLVLRLANAWTDWGRQRIMRKAFTEKWRDVSGER